MNATHSLRALLNNTATEEDIALLKQLLASGEISIGGNVNHSVIIIGTGNTVELPPAALDRLSARPMLGNLDRDLTGEEIAAGLRRLDKLLTNRAPILLSHYKEQVGRLRPTLKTEVKSLSESTRRERVEALAAINSICVEAVDVSFNGLALGEEAPKYDARSPFRGLESFRPEDSEFFFGREALTEKLVGKIKAHSFLAVLGASGSGKSSLVMAGVIPALDLDYAIFRPGTKPLDELESARGKALIVVDQFEELLTLTCEESIRKEFITRLLNESSRARIILTLRSDFLGEVGAYRALSAEIQNHLEIVPPMDVDELRRAMEGQAGVVGLRFEADLSQQILDDVEGEPGAMPLLQHALWELWNRRHGRNLRASEYRAFGGVKQAITSTAEKVYADCSKPEQDQVRDIFLRLTRLDEGDEGRDTRRRVLLSDLIPSGRDAASITLLFDKLANARLIVKTVNEDKTEVEVAHEALIRHWERLRIWLNEDRDALRLREGVSEDATRWEKSSRSELLLNHRGGRLDDALLLSVKPYYGYTSLEQTYLNACMNLRNKEQHEREQRLRYVVISSVVAAVIFLALGGFGLSKSNDATSQAGTAQANANLAMSAQAISEEQANIALSRQLSAQGALLTRSGYPEEVILGSLLSIESFKLHPNVQALSSLQYGISLIPEKVGTIKGDEGKYTDYEFVMGDASVVVGVIDKTAYVWDVLTGQEVSRMIHDDVINSIAVSPNGALVISGSDDGIARVWNTTTGQEVSRIIHENGVKSVSFSPDGTKVISRSKDDKVLIWDPITGNEIFKIINNDYVMSMQFSRDGRKIIVGLCDGSATIWDIFSKQEIIKVYPGQGCVSVAFSPDGKYIVTGSESNYAQVLDASTGFEISSMEFQHDVYSVDFSPDGELVVAGSYDNTAVVWDAFTGEEKYTVRGFGEVEYVLFSPDGTLMGIGDGWGIIRVTNTETGKIIALIDGGPYFSFSSDSKYLISPYYYYLSSPPSSLNIWKIKPRPELIQIGHGDNIKYSFFSNTEKFIYTHGDQNMSIWNVEDGELLSRISVGDNFIVQESILSPDERWLVVDFARKSVEFQSDQRIYEHVILIWDILNQREVIRFENSGDIFNQLNISEDGKWLVVLENVIENNTDSTDIYHIWDVDNKVKVVSFEESINEVLSEDLKWKFLIRDEVKIIDNQSGQEVAEIKPLDKYLHCKSEMVSMAYYGDLIYFWDTKNNTPQSYIKVEEGKGCLSLDGNYYAQVKPHGDYVRIYNTKTGMEEFYFTQENVNGNLLSFSPSGKYISSIGEDGKMRVGLWKASDLLSVACQRLVDEEINLVDWERYFPADMTYSPVCENMQLNSIMEKFNTDNSINSQMFWHPFSDEAVNEYVDGSVKLENTNAIGLAVCGSCFVSDRFIYSAKVSKSESNNVAYGLAFSINPDGFYIFEINPATKSFWVYKRENNNWVFLGDGTSQFINTFPESNKLSVQYAQGEYIFYINDMHVFTYYTSSLVPENSNNGMLGLYINGIGSLIAQEILVETDLDTFEGVVPKVTPIPNP